MGSKPRTTSTVVRAAVTREGQVLLVRRARGERLESQWELPGGTLAAGESLGEALHRELWEETGLRPAGLPALIATAARTTPSGRDMDEFSFLVPVDGELRLSPEHDRAIWHRPGDFPPGPVTEAAAEALEHL